MHRQCALQAVRHVALESKPLEAGIHCSSSGRERIYLAESALFSSVFLLFRVLAPITVCIEPVHLVRHQLVKQQTHSEDVQLAYLVLEVSHLLFNCVDMA